MDGSGSDRGLGLCWIVDLSEKVPVRAVSLPNENCEVSCLVPVAVVQQTAVRGKLMPS